MRARNIERCLMALATTALVAGCQNLSGLNEFVVSSQTGQAGAGNGGSAGSGGSAGAGGESPEGGSAGSGSNEEELGGSGGEAGVSGEAGSGGSDAGSGGTSGSGGTNAGSGGSGGSAGSGGITPCKGTSEPGGQCASSCDCAIADGEVCNQPNFSQMRTYCGQGQSGLSLGQPCIDDEDCASGLCDIYSLTCSVFCAEDVHCGKQGICLPSEYKADWYPLSCQNACRRNSDCTPNFDGAKTCMLQRDEDNNRWALGCSFIGPDLSPKTFGDEMGDDDLCDTQMRLRDSNNKSYCSRACISDADCGAPLPKCATLQITNPSGVGFSTFTGCVK